MTQLLIKRALVTAGLMITAAVLGASCSSDPETSSTEGGGGTSSQSTSGQTTMSQSSTTGMSSSSGEGGGGQGGQGGGGCGDTLTDPNNCGACGNLCAPGQACEAGACVCSPNATATFAEVQAIFGKSCGSAGFCHNKDNPSGGLDLRPGAAHASLVGTDTKYCGDGRKRVTAGQPSESYIIDKVMNTQLCDLPNGKSSKMPPGSTLPLTDVETIANWICAGAMP